MMTSPHEGLIKKEKAGIFPVKTFVLEKGK
jgi:hypothetical protein